jgi:SAM-dependent methyltransferase
MTKDTVSGLSASQSSRYALDNAGSEAAARFPALSAGFDAGSIRHLEALGVSAGWRCLEVGAGGGSIASWLAACVGPTGHVLATDIDTRFLDSLALPNMEVRRHDIATDALPPAAFDLIHARLVLVHVPEREEVLARLVASLKPGGWILGEEFDSSISPDPSLHAPEALSKTFVAMRQVLADRGVDRMFGRRLFGRLRDLHLADVGAEGRTLMWSSGSAGASLMRANFEQLHDEMVRRGYVTEQEFARDLEAVDAHDFVMPSPVLWAAWGRRAA